LAFDEKVMILDPPPKETRGPVETEAKGDSWSTYERGRASSNIKDDNTIMNAHNSSNASNSRNESNNRTANTVGTSAKAGMLAKVVKSTAACKDAKCQLQPGFLT
jgi:hypothetical protein